MILCQTHADDANHACGFRLAFTHFRFARNVIELVPLAVGALQDTLGTEHLSALFFVLDGFQSSFNLLSAVFVSGGNTEFIEHFVRIVAMVVMMVVVTASALMVMVVLMLIMVVVMMMLVVAAATVFLMVVVLVVMVVLAAALVVVLIMVVVVMMVFRLVLCLLPMRFLSQMIQLRG